jgi:Raf kinase inhibitor-like YbhB/YbcL family protein
MRSIRKVSLAALGLALAAATTLSAQATGTNPPGGRGDGRGGRGGGGGGRGRAPMVVMTLTSKNFQNGGAIPVANSQAGPKEMSPELSWTGAPDSTVSFVLVAHDISAPTGNGTDDMLHWLVWNIPGSARSLAEGVPQGPNLPDGSRQISASGPYYRGPAAPPTGPAHTYVFELYALDTMLDVPPVTPGQQIQPAVTRAAVMSAMAGHVRGKAALVGTFRRAAP